MRLPIFNESIKKSHNILKPFGIDLVNIISDTNPNTLNNTINDFVAIIAIQVNTTLKQLRINVNYKPPIYILKFHLDCIV